MNIIFNAHQSKCLQLPRSFSFIGLWLYPYKHPSVYRLNNVREESLLNYLTFRKQKKSSEDSCRHGMETYNPCHFNLNGFVVMKQAKPLISCQINVKHPLLLNHHTMQNPKQQQHAQLPEMGTSWDKNSFEPGTDNFSYLQAKIIKRKRLQN